MITVKFCGVLRLAHKVNELQIEDVSNIKELVKQVSVKVPTATEKELRACLIFINDENITHLKMYRSRLSDGDKVIFMSPVGGG